MSVQVVILKMAHPLSLFKNDYHSRSNGIKMDKPRKTQVYNEARLFVNKAWTPTLTNSQQPLDRGCCKCRSNDVLPSLISSVLVCGGTDSPRVQLIQLEPQNVRVPEHSRIFPSRRGAGLTHVSITGLRKEDWDVLCTGKFAIKKIRYTTHFLYIIFY